jgi:DNA-directed RNA polymerase subunit RPC12/RpoP
MPKYGKSSYKILFAISIVTLFLISTIPAGAAIDSFKSNSASLLQPTPETGINDGALESTAEQLGDRTQNYFQEDIELHFEYEFSKLDLPDKTWDYIDMIDGQYFTTPGQAMIPYKTHIITSPLEILEVSLDLRNPLIIEEIIIVPAPNLIPFGPLGDELMDNRYEADPNYYSKSEFLPIENFGIAKLGAGEVDNERVWFYSITIYTCRYNPALSEIVLYQDCTISVRYNQPTGPENNEDDGTGETHSRSSRGTEPKDAKYLILTAGYLMNEMQVLADWKTQKGVPAKIYDVEEIFTNNTLKGRDDEETLRNFVRWSYNNQNTEYVLLAGDYDRVPPRMTKDPSPYLPPNGPDDGWIPSDIYYACIDTGSTWDVDNDDLFGEQGDLDDIIPDLAIGRLAINSETEMKLKIQEILEYEQNPPAGNWFGRATLVGADVHNKDDGMEQCKYYKGKYLDSTYDTFAELYDPDDTLDTSSLKSAINQGSSLLVYLGHGASYLWTHEVKGTSTLLYKTDVETLTNGLMKPVITTVSCDTSWFDQSSHGDCIGEYFTEKLAGGAIGYLGSTRTTVGGIYQKYGPMSPGLQEDFLRQINLGNLQLGSAYVEGMAHYSQIWGSRFASSGSGEEQACWMEQHLLGEPELTLWVNKPENFNVINYTEEETITITVKNDQQNVIKDALVCVWLEGEVYEYGLTDGSGKIKFTIISKSGDEASMTVTKKGYLPYISKIKLLDLIPPVTTYELLPGVPDGMNDWYTEPPLINFSTNEQNSITYYILDDTGVPVEFSGAFYAPEGLHTLNYYSVDASNNIESSRYIIVKVDTITPMTGMKCTPAEPDGENSWFVSVPEIELIGEQTTTVFYHWDSEPNKVYSSSIFGLVGEHTFYYHARDEAGHIEPTQSLKLKIDLDVPRTTITINPTFPDGDHNWYNTKPKITIDVKETNDFETYFYWDDNSDSPILYNGSFVPDFEGKHTLYYFTEDEAGNIEDLKWLEIKIDTVKPETTINITPSKPTGLDNWYNGESPVLSFICTEESNTYYYWDIESGRTIYSNPISAPEGEHMLFYYSVDAAGNRESINKEFFKVDTVVPSATQKIFSESAPNSDGWYLEMPNIEFEMDEEGVIYYYMLEDGSSLDDFDEEQLNLMRQSYYSIYPVEGIYTFFFYAVDEAGNVGDMNELTIKLDLFDPEPALKVDKYQIMEGEWIILDSSDSNDENPIISYKFFIGKTHKTEWLDSPELNYTFNTPGTFELYVKVQDASGRISEASESITILVKPKPTDAVEDVMGAISSPPMMIALFIIVIVFLLVITLFIRHRKSKMYIIEPEIEEYGGPELKSPRSVLGLSSKPSGHSITTSLRKRMRLKSPKALPPPPPPPSIVKIVSKGKAKKILDDDGVEWENGPSRIVTADDDEIEWENETENRIKLECPLCGKYFKSKSSSLENSNNIRCPHCGAKGGI